MDLIKGRMGVSTTLRERAAGEYAFELPGNEALAAFIADRASIGIALAEALVWGESCAPTVEELARIAGAFALDPDLLSILLVPSSPDVVEHVMRNVVLDALNTEDCGLCYDIEAAILGAGEAETEVALMALSHLTLAGDDESGGDADDDDPDVHEVETLLATVSGLDRPARQRILAFALGEATNIDVDAAARRTRAFAALRQDLFSHLLNAAFDQIAVTGDGEIEEEVLAHRLNLGDPRSLRRLPGLVSEALAGLPDPAALAEPPLRVVESPEGIILSLGVEAREAWLALLEAERSPLLISRPAA